MNNGKLLVPLIEHYNGSQWSVVSTPNLHVSSSIDLNAVIALAANNVWIAGGVIDTSALLEHWDGSKWSVVVGPQASNYMEIYSITAYANTVWGDGTAYGEGLMAGYYCQ